MLDKVPIDPQQAIKRESPFTDETDLILSLFEVRLNIQSPTTVLFRTTHTRTITLHKLLNILMTIFCARVTKVVYSL